MPESMNSDSLQQQIAQIEKDLMDKRAQLEQQKLAGQISELPHEKAILKEVVNDMIHGTPTSVPSQIAQDDDTTQQDESQTLPSPPPQVDTPLYLSPELKNKIQDLVNLSFTKSIDEGIKLAKKSNNAALIDAFHDALVDELFDQLVSQGKLKKL